MNNYIDVPTQLIPNFFTPGLGPDFVAAQFGLPWNASGGLTLSQLIFDGSYLVGLKATRALAEQSQQDLEKAATDARNQAAKAYFGVLAAEEGERLTGEGIPLLEKSLNEVTAMKDAGFMEDTDVDRMTIQLEQAKAQQRSFKQQADVARMLLALALGVPQGTPITLTDDLAGIVNNADETALSEQPMDPAGHVELRYAENLVVLQDLEPQERTQQGHAIVGWISQPPTSMEWSGLRPRWEISILSNHGLGVEIDRPDLQQWQSIPQSETSRVRLAANRSEPDRYGTAPAHIRRTEPQSSTHSLRQLPHRGAQSGLGAEHLRPHQHQILERCCGKFRTHARTGQLPPRPTDLHPTCRGATDGPRRPTQSTRPLLSPP